MTDPFMMAGIVAGATVLNAFGAAAALKDSAKAFSLTFAIAAAAGAFSTVSFFAEGVEDLHQEQMEAIEAISVPVPTPGQ